MSRFARLLGLLLLGCLVSAATAAATATEDFFADPDMLSAKLNPQGTLVAALRGYDTSQRVDLLSPEGDFRGTLSLTSDLVAGDATIVGFHWVDRLQLAVQISEVRQGVLDLLDTGISRKLVILEVPEQPDTAAESVTVVTPGWLVEALPQVPNKFLYARSGRVSRVYRLDTKLLAEAGSRLSKLSLPDGGQFTRKNEVVSIDGYAIRWFLDSEGLPHSALVFSPDYSLVLKEVVDSGESRELAQWSQEEMAAAQSGTADRPVLLPVALAPGEGNFYCLDIAELQQRSVYRVNFDADERELVYQSDDSQIVNLTVAPDTRALLGLQTLHRGVLRNVYVDGRVSGASGDTGSEMRILIDAPVDSEYSLVYAESHAAPGVIFSVNPDSGEQHLIGAVYPHLKGPFNTRQVSGEVVVSGLEIPYLLSLPTSPGSHALLVMPHGGPIGVFDSPYFDLLTQFLVSEGFAVLRVNFRGSGGHGVPHQEAGKGEWGGLMIEDVAAATREVISRSDVDEARVCLFGMSYGGYAAYMLSIHSPDLFICGVSVAGISDLALHTNSTRFNDAQRRWLVDQLGDPQTDYPALKAISPVYQAEDIGVPFLIAHGGRDDVVEVEQSYRMAAALEKNGKPHKLLVLEEGGHDLGTPEQQTELMRAVLEFIEAVMPGA